MVLGCGSVFWIHLFQNRSQWLVILNTVTLPDSIKFLEFLKWLSNCWLLKRASSTKK
jgi:hypothetical protein